MPVFGRALLPEALQFHELALSYREALNLLLLACAIISIQVSLNMLGAERVRNPRRLRPAPLARAFARLLRVPSPASCACLRPPLAWFDGGTSTSVRLAAVANALGPASLTATAVSALGSRCSGARVATSPSAPT